MPFAQPERRAALTARLVLSNRPGLRIPRPGGRVRLTKADGLPFLLDPSHACASQCRRMEAMRGIGAEGRLLWCVTCSGRMMISYQDCPDAAIEEVTRRLPAGGAHWAMTVH